MNSEKYIGLDVHQATLGLSAAAAAMSSTILKTEMIPNQLSWLGAAGTVVAACMIPISFIERKVFSAVLIRRTLAAVILLTLVGLVWLRASCVVRVSYPDREANWLIGISLSPDGVAAKQRCGVTETAALIKCAGPEMIPNLYGRSFGRLYYAYAADYLLLLGCFVGLLSSLDVTPANAQIGGAADH